MRISIFVAVCLALATIVASPSAHADDTAVYQKLIEDKASTVVSVKFVMNIKVMRGGTPVMAPQEQSGSTSGVIVDASGLILVPGQVFSPVIPRQFRAQGLSLAATPSNIRVVFPGDTREYQAVLGAKDSKLGLAFVLVKDLKEKKIQGLDLAAAVDPKVGQTLYGVSRLGQGFDHAPMVSRMKVVGSVTKPRTMWIIQGAGNGIGKPAYDASGAMTGIVVTQEGVGEDSETRPFLLPLKVAKPTIATALKKSKQELDRILEEEEEAAAEAAEDEGEDEPKKDAPKKDEPKKDAPKKDDGKKDGE